MQDFTFLHAADLHLDSPLRLGPDAPAKGIRTATRQALVKLVDCAVGARVSFVLLAGDLYDSKDYDWHTGRFLLEQLGRLTRAGIEVVAVAGNHDPLQGVARDLAVPGMFCGDKPETAFLANVPVAIHGQSYAVAETTVNLTSDYPARIDGLFNVGLLHTACGQSGYENYAPCTVADLQRLGYDYWALGHVHVRNVLARDPWIVFPGNLQGRSINEEGSKGATLVKVECSQVKTAEHVSLDVVRWQKLHVDLTGATGADVWNRIGHAIVQATLLSDGRFLVLRVVLSGECETHTDLAGDCEATRTAVRAVAVKVAGEENVYINDVWVLTAPESYAALRAQPGLVGAVIRSLESPVALDQTAKDFAREQVERFGSMLEQDHPAFAIAKGHVPEEIAARARALVLAELIRRTRASGS